MAQRNTYFQDEIIQNKIDIKQFGRILRYILPFKKIFALVGFLMMVTAVTSMISPLLLRYIINNVVVSKDYRQLLLIVIGLSMLAAIEISITLAQQRLMGWMGYSIIGKIREDIFYKLQQLSFDYFDSRPAGKIVIRVTDYINDLANFFTNFVLMFLIYIVKLVVVTVFMLIISPQLTVIVLAAVVPMMTCVFVLRYSTRKLFGANRAKISNRTAFLVESIMGEKIVKNYNRADMNEEIYKEVHDISINQWMKIVVRNELNTPIVDTFWNIGALFLYGVSLFMILHGNSNVDAGTVVAFISYMSLFSAPLTQIAMLIQQLAQVSSNMEQVFDTIDYPVDIESKSSGIELKDINGQVDFDNVTFAYEEGVNILENFNLHVKPGETIALVGPTGAGKTTVINTITRFYDVNKGSVKIDGIDVREACLDSLRKEVGVLMQDPFIFKGTVIDNIRYGRVDATDEECIQAARTILQTASLKSLRTAFIMSLRNEVLGFLLGRNSLLVLQELYLRTLLSSYWMKPPVLLIRKRRIS